MIRSNLKTGFRSITKQRTLSIINIIGLSAGLTCATLIALWVGDELSYDKFNKHYNRIVRVVGSAQTEMGTTESAVTSAPMAAALKNDFPEVEKVVRLRMRSDIVHHDERQLFQDGILLTDPSFFDVFTFTLSRGNQATALNDPFRIVLTESSAKKYFGDKDPIGETLTINMYDSAGYGALYTITGVMPDPPENSHFTFSMLASFKTVEVANPDVLTTNGWGDASYYTYVLLREGTNEQAFSRKIRQFYGKHIGSLFEIWKDVYSYRIQPLRDIHLRSHLQHEIAPTGSMNQIYLFSAIGVFILLLAGINYVNLAIAGSTRRAKEVGVKKVIGAKKIQLVQQYLLESVLTSLLAVVISLLAVSLLQPFFHQLTGKNLLIFSSPWLIVLIAGVSTLLCILAGIYPAMVLSSFAPLRILKGNFQQGRQGITLRKSLVVAQFTITIVLITSIIVVNRQMEFVKHQDLGYRSETLLFLKVHGNTDVINGYAGFKNEILMSPLISSVTTSNTIPVGGIDGGESETIDGNGNSIQVSTSRLRTDADYFDAYGLQLLAGRNFRPGLLSDTIRPVILNETAVKTFGWGSPETAIGKPFKIGDQYGEVLGVVKDFHFNSLHERIEPLAIYPVNERFSRITLSANLSNSGDAMARVEEVWKKHFPTALFDFAFVDDQVGHQYFAEQRFSVIVTYFSVVSLVIACLGLYGLVLFAASQKVKEIGIRKVLGASVNGIVVMLSGEFVKLVTFSAILAAPIAWYIMNLWLENFAFRTPITWWMMAAAGLVVLVLSIITVSTQAIRSAMVNPVKSLKSE